MSVFSRYKYATDYKQLLLACYFFYFCTIAIKLTYGAQMLEIITAFNTTKSNAALGLTIYYFVYAAAQIVLSLFIEKINIKRFILVTTIMSALSFALISCGNELWQLWLILGLNGIFQSAGWGGIIFIIGKHFPEDTLSYTYKFLATGFAIANAATYAFSALFVQFFSWRYTFVFFAALYIVSLAAMLYQEKKLEKKLRTGDEYKFEAAEKKQTSIVIPAQVKLNNALFLTFIFTISLFTTAILYGTSNWIPNLLKEEHGFPSSLSLLITLIMPVITMPATILMYTIFDKTSKIMKSTIYVGIILLALFVIMTFDYGTNMLFAIIMSGLLRFFTQCFSASSSSYMMMKLKHHINIGKSTLMVNSIASIGAGLAPFITAAVMDASGWRAYYIMLSLMTAVSLLVVCIGYIVIQKRKNISDWI